MKGSAAVPLALVPTVLPAGPVALGGDVPHVQRAQHGPITVLSRPPENAGDRLMMSLSENVFVRLTAACDHVFRLNDKVDKVGSVTARSHRMISMDRQMNCHVDLPIALAGDNPPEFEYDDFIDRTSHWTDGQMLEEFDYYRVKEDNFKHFDPKEHPPNAAKLLEGKRICGMLPLPHGCLWVGNYVCEQTGLCMRTVSTYDLSWDGYKIRWDVLCG